MADYKWTYASIGGSTRVKIQSGEDIRHLGRKIVDSIVMSNCRVGN